VAKSPAVNTAPNHLRVALLTWEDAAVFEALHAGYMTAYLPVGPAEVSLVEQLTWLDWRRRRLQLGERALHMAQLEARTSDKRFDTLSRRACQMADVGRPQVSSVEAVRRSDAGDREADAAFDEMEETVREALALIDEHGAQA
jgi:hypothetical protein